MAKRKRKKAVNAGVEQTGNGEQQPAAGPSKMSMVREALGELGSDAKPKDIGEYITKKYGTDIDPSMISAYKSSINGGGGNRSRAGGRGGNGEVSVADIEAVRGLIGRVGATQLGELVKVLGK